MKKSCVSRKGCNGRNFRDFWSSGRAAEIRKIFTKKVCRTMDFVRQILVLLFVYRSLAMRERYQRSAILSSLSLVLSTKMERSVSRWSIWRMVNGFCAEAMSMVVLPALVLRT